MKITIKNSAASFNGIKEGDMFFYVGRLYIKRLHTKGGNSYNAFQVGEENSGNTIGGHEGVIPVTEVEVS